MEINWQRGALRLWVVAAVVWCAVIVVLNWSEMEVATTSKTVHIKFTNAETWDYPVAWGVERIEADLKTRLETLDKAELEWLARVPEARKAECLAIRPDTLFTDMPEDCGRMALALLQKDTGSKRVVSDNNWQARVRSASAERWQGITKLTLWVLGPPLFVLALGLSLIWAFAGFRRAPKPSR